jgi:hypothetical protein
MMGRIDWLRDVGVGFEQAVLAIALEIWVIFDEKSRMARMDWAEGGEHNGWEGYGGRKGAERWDGEDRLDEIEIWRTQ